MNASSLIEVEGRAAGRVIPGWRVTLIATIAATGVGITPIFQGELWMTLVTIFVSSFTVTALLHPYRRRSIS